MTSTATTNQALPQHFSYVCSAKYADKALEIIDLKQAEFGAKSSSDAELQKVVIRDAAVAKAQELINPASADDIRIIRLEEGDLKITKVKNESGFRLVDVGAIRRGDGANAEIVTVFFVRSASNPEVIIPLVYAHNTKSEIGWKVKKAIDSWCQEIHGESAEALVTSATSRFFHRLTSLLDDSEERAKDLAKKQEAIKEWASSMPERVEFVRLTLESINLTSNTDSKAELLSQIQLQHYDDLITMIENGDKEQKVKAAKALSDLAIVEMDVIRKERYLTRTEGPSKSSKPSFDMHDNPTRVQTALFYIKHALSHALVGELRKPLGKALDHLSKGVTAYSYRY